MAANSVAQVARQLATVVAFGVSNATAIYLGKTIGAKEFHLAKEYGKRFFLWLSIITGAVGGGIILIVCSDCKSCDDTLTGSAGVSLFYVFCYVLLYTLPGDQYDPCGGCIPGRRRYQVWSDPGCVYHVGMLYSSGYDRAFVFHAPVQVVYILLMSDEVIKVPITVMRYRSYKWIQNVTREKAELA